MALWGSKQDPAALHQQGVTAFEQGDFETAIKQFTQAIEAEPNADRHYYRGVIHDLTEQPKLALKDLRQAVKLDPNHTQALYSLSIIYTRQEHLESAFATVQQAYQIDPDDFRIANHYATLLLNSPFAEHNNPELAVQVSKRACELTEFRDELCLETHQQALKAVGELARSANVADQLEAAAETLFLNQRGYDSTPEVIAHVESRFKATICPNSLQNIVSPSQVSIAVQTIESSTDSGSNLIFTTGMSNAAVGVSKQDAAFRFVELLMIIPGDWHRPAEPSSDRIWPWQTLMALAHQPHVKGKGYVSGPQVIRLTETLAPFGPQEKFCAMLLLPGLQGYLAPLKSSGGNLINFITCVPIYRGEYELAQGPSGAMGLFKRFQTSKTRPFLIPNRPNLADA